MASPSCLTPSVVRVKSSGYPCLKSMRRRRRPQDLTISIATKGQSQTTPIHFVSSRENDIPERFILGQEDVMHGFNLAVSSMQPGEKAIFTIPPALTMTKAGSPASIPSNIPPNQTLRFEIELIAMFTVIDIFEDEGILKKIVKNAESDREQSHSMKYNACLMDGTSVSKSEGVEFRLTDDAFGEQGRPSQGEETAVPPDATLYVHLQFVCWIRQIGEDQGIAKKTLSIGNSQRIHTQSQAVVKGEATWDKR
uniref:peptidylprolyl isomerase n=1 Tax=Oryza barthii TaxID=65489 RepID=A0A0D3EQ87_9ORYZ